MSSYHSVDAAMDDDSGFSADAMPSSSSPLSRLPDKVVLKIFSFCDPATFIALSLAELRLGLLARELLPMSPCQLQLEDLPTELLLNIFSFLDRRSLGRLSQVNRHFREITYADCLWAREAKESLMTNGQDPAMAAASADTRSLSARDKVRISRNWVRGIYSETKEIVQKLRYMPRLQLDGGLLWVSWGNRIWAHPRSRSDGTISRSTTRVLKGHTDDVSRFVVRDGLLVSGGRDGTMVGWSANTGEFLFAKRYCHGGEVSSVDVLPSSQLVISGSRDRTVKLWALGGGENLDNYNHHQQSFPSLLQTINIGDRIWSLSASPSGDKVVIGSAGLGGVPALHLLDLGSLAASSTSSSSGILPALQPMGAELKKGAATLDLHWHNENTFISCGHDTFARMWDTRIGSCVRTWEEPFDEAIYCLSTDNHVSLVCGTARHGLVRLWDMRQTQPVQMFYARHAHKGQSSPVYSVAFDQSNLYVAQDQCLNLLSFSGLNNRQNMNRFGRAKYESNPVRLSGRRERKGGW